VSECQGYVQLGVPVDPIEIIDVPTFGITSSDAQNRRLVTDIICDLVARMVAKLLITEEVCSVVEFLNLPLNKGSRSLTIVERTLSKVNAQPCALNSCQRLSQITHRLHRYHS
jgi:hypothetical protein